ncbi:MAG: hypothetical protein VR64_16660 [Desulfatitalea sp. BRH_c12]|nr:MAG: hypothetical protein VR64_16660 [Desulfatitalea sp. BRH_c12]
MFLGMHYAPAPAYSKIIPFVPGEKLEYAFRWKNIPAGSVQLEILPVKTFKDEQVYHFVLTAKTNKYIDKLYKVRDRIDAYADISMTRTVHYQKKQRGGRERNEVVAFDWPNNQAQYSNFGQKKEPIAVVDGSFDPLSAFYYSRTMDFEDGGQFECPITNGKKNGVGRLYVVGRETITLADGKTYDTYRLEPELNQFGGVFNKSNDATLQLWVTTDSKRIPVRIHSKVRVGHFIGELVSATGTQ